MQSCEKIRQRRWEKCQSTETKERGTVRIRITRVHWFSPLAIFRLCNKWRCIREELQREIRSASINRTILKNFARVNKIPANEVVIFLLTSSLRTKMEFYFIANLSSPSVSFLIAYVCTRNNDDLIVGNRAAPFHSRTTTMNRVD